MRISMQEIILFLNNALKELYHNKCAYCETDAGAGAVLRIEHYRPRKGIKGEYHSGYYWLTYEWSNLLPACEKCNSSKSNRFPLEPTGKRAAVPVLIEGKLSRADCLADSGVLRAEKPLMLHPEIDEPERDMIFLPDGTVRGRADRDWDRGKRTIEVCRLDRVELVLARKKVVDRFLARIRELLDDLVEQRGKKEFSRRFDRFLIKLLKAHEPHRPYSRLGWFMFQKFELFFVKQLGKKGQRVVRKAYESFRDRYKTSWK